MIADVGTEKMRNLGILKKMNKKKAVLDVTKAVNTHIDAEQKRFVRQRAIGLCVQPVCGEVHFVPIYVLLHSISIERLIRLLNGYVVVCKCL